jgi:hypothetical protein
MKPQDKNTPPQGPAPKKEGRFRIDPLEERIAPCSDASGPPGTCGSGPPGLAPGNSNPPGGK